LDVEAKAADYDIFVQDLVRIQKLKGPKIIKDS